MSINFEADTRAVEEVFPDLGCPVLVTGNKVLVQLRRAHTKTKSGLYLAPSTVQEMKYDEVIAKVIRLGPLAYHSRNNDTGELVPWSEGPWCQVGDIVRTIKFGGDRWSIPYEDDFVHYIIVHDREIIAKLSNYDDARHMIQFF